MEVALSFNTLMHTEPIPFLSPAEARCKSRAMPSQAANNLPICPLSYMRSSAFILCSR